MKNAYKHSDGEGQGKDKFIYDEIKIMLALISLPQPEGTKDNGIKPLAFKEKHFTHVSSLVHKGDKRCSKLCKGSDSMYLNILRMQKDLVKS